MINIITKLKYIISKLKKISKLNNMLIKKIYIK